jgi:hypothetical protein
MHDVRSTGSPARLVFALGALLSLLAGIQLFVLPDHTEEYFAWTIGTRSSAAFLGAFYWGAAAVAVVSLRRAQWARARVGLYGLIAFFWITLVTTFLHLDRFHLGDGGSAARIAAWAWLLVYLVLPPLATAAVVLPRRMGGTDPAALMPMRGWHRAALLVLGTGLLAIAVILFTSPTAASGIWPWDLTPLTARASSAWVVGLAVILVTMAWEGDLERVIPAAVGIGALPVLLGIALGRLADEVDWVAGAGYLVVVAAVWLAGGLGVLVGWWRRSAQAITTPAAPAAPASPES